MLLESARIPTAEFLAGPVSPSKWGFLQSRVPASTYRPMEVVEGKRSFLNRRSADEPPKFKWGDGGPNNRVLVVIDANKELLNTAMDWALDHVVQHGDALRLLAILQHICNPSKSGFQAGLSRLGYKSWADDSSWNGTNRSVLDSELASKRQSLQNNLDLHLRCQKLGVDLEIDVQLSRDPKTLVVDEAKKLGATHVVLDRSLKKDKKHFIDNLSCNVVRVKSIDVSEPLRSFVPEMVISAPILNPKPGLEPQPPAPTSASHRRSTASSYLSCLAESDLISMRDDVDGIEVESSHGSTTFNNVDVQINTDNSAVRMWLIEHGSPEHGVYPREESLQLSGSPNSEIASPSTEGSFAGRLSSLPKLNTNLSPLYAREATIDMVSNPCTSPVSDVSPTADSSLTQSSESLLSRVRPLSSLIPAASTTFPALDYCVPAGASRADLWSPMDICSYGNGNGAHAGPISVQPRRADASWTLQNLNELLNGGDHGKYYSPVEKQSVQKLEAESWLIDQERKLSLPKEMMPVLTAKNMKPVGIQRTVEITSNVRPAVFMKKKGPSTPPLCTICKHKSPEFGRAVKRFRYAELLEATENFHHRNYLAQGGYGSVYRGLLPEGQLIAVKQHKLASSQGDQEFCAEVEVLSCAQHRNLVTLIGYCVEDTKRLLVYEYVCNGSLDWHLSSKNKTGLQWTHRQKIALGAARALLYLHEECRVGCIVHRDMRPNNILLTHEFTPMVGDFGLARRQLNGETAEETRVIGTLGYLAPEYAASGQITDKADVYAFGVVLLEIITGRKPIDNQNSRGERCLTEWAGPLLDNYSPELVDPRLKVLTYDEYEMQCMMHAARQCIKKDPTMRPRMSQVLRILDPSHQSDTPYGMGARKVAPGYPADSPTPDPDAQRALDNGRPASSPHSVLDSQSETNVVRIQTKPARSRSTKKLSKSWLKTERSASAPRLSYDEETNNDPDDVPKDPQRLSYECMLDII